MNRRTFLKFASTSLAVMLLAAAAQPHAHDWQPHGTAWFYRCSGCGEVKSRYELSRWHL